MTYQEAFYADSGRFTAALDSAFYQASTGVTVTVTDVSTDGFRATATHERLPGWVCRIEQSSAPESGTPVCVATERP
jgi:hypothetical protein